MFHIVLNEKAKKEVFKNARTTFRKTRVSVFFVKILQYFFCIFCFSQAFVTRQPYEPSSSSAKDSDLTSQSQAKTSPNTVSTNVKSEDGRYYLKLLMLRYFDDPFADEINYEEVKYYRGQVTMTVTSKSRTPSPNPTSQSQEGSKMNFKTHSSFIIGLFL